VSQDCSAGERAGRPASLAYLHNSGPSAAGRARMRFFLTGESAIFGIRCAPLPIVKLPRREQRSEACGARQSKTGTGRLKGKIEDYALIGDCETAALVSRNGSIDWLCWPRFDSHACFAALLGGPEHGRWRVAPAGELTHSARRYRDDTLVLETDLETADGAVTVIDFMPPRTVESDLVRLVVGRRGSVP